jgi:hypothetical protein
MSKRVHGVTILTEDMGDRRPADMGDTKLVFDAVASEMVSMTRRSAVNDGGGSPRRSRQLTARDLAEVLQCLALLHSRPAGHGRSDEAEVGPQVVDEAESNVREEDVAEASPECVALVAIGAMSASRSSPRQASPPSSLEPRRLRRSRSSIEIALVRSLIQANLRLA